MINELSISVCIVAHVCLPLWVDLPSVPISPESQEDHHTLAHEVEGQNLIVCCIVVKFVCCRTLWKPPLEQIVVVLSLMFPLLPTTVFSFSLCTLGTRPYTLRHRIFDCIAGFLVFVMDRGSTNPSAVGPRGQQQTRAL
jgi:hypothetical protein